MKKIKKYYFLAVLIFGCLSLGSCGSKRSTPSYKGHFGLPENGRFTLNSNYYDGLEIFKWKYNNPQKGINPQQESKIRHPLQELNNVHDLVCANGNLWIGTSGGLLVYDPRTNQWKVALDDRKRLFTTISTLSYSFPFLWVAGAAGIHRLNLQDNTILSWEINDLTEYGFYRTITSGPPGAWASDGTNAVYQFNPDNNSIKNLRIPPGEPNGAPIATQLFYDDGLLWVANRNGLMSYDPKTDKMGEWKTDIAKVDYYLSSRWTSDAKYIYFGTAYTPAGQLVRFDKKLKKWESLSSHASFPLAKQDDLIWVGASYDLTPVSRFALRYMKDFDREWKTGFVYKNLYLSKILPLGKDLWFGGALGLLKWTPGSKTVYQHKAESAGPVAEFYVPLKFTQNEISLTDVNGELHLNIR